MKRVVLSAILTLHILFAGALPVDSKQVLLVTSSSWSAPSGKLQRYELKNAKWVAVGKSISVELGRKGLAWGRGLHTIPKGTKRIKREGDKRAPAGVFRLPFVFGTKSPKIEYPYRKMSSVSRCVDDSRSVNYNRVIDSSKSAKDYNSYENMKLSNGLYDYGIFVEHNIEQVPQGGSCIFLHIRKGMGKPTVGCTAMDRDKIKELIVWLKPEKNPLLIQAPSSEIDRLFRP